MTGGTKYIVQKMILMKILPIFKISTKRIIKINPPRMLEKKFLILKLKAKWIIDKITIITKIYPVGACFDRKASPKIIGRINQ